MYINALDLDDYGTAVEVRRERKPKKEDTCFRQLEGLRKAEERGNFLEGHLVSQVRQQCALLQHANERSLDSGMIM